MSRPEDASLGQRIADQVKTAVTGLEALRANESVPTWVRPILDSSLSALGMQAIVITAAVTGAEHTKNLILLLEGAPNPSTLSQTNQRILIAHKARIREELELSETRLRQRIKAFNAFLLPERVNLADLEARVKQAGYVESIARLEEELAYAQERKRICA